MRIAAYDSGSGREQVCEAPIFSLCYCFFFITMAPLSVSQQMICQEGGSVRNKWIVPGDPMAP